MNRTVKGASDLRSRDSLAGPEASIFDSLTYIQAWREHLGVGQPWDLTFPDCVAPLILVPERHCRLPLRVLKPTGTLGNPSNVVIPFNRSHLECLLSCLREHKSEWDALEFVVTMNDPTAADSIRHVLKRHALRLIRCNDVRRPYVRIESPWEDYYRKRSKNVRQDITRRLNKMKRSGGMRVECTTGDDGLNALETFFALHQKRWAHRGLSSMYAEKSYCNFMRTFLGRCGSETWWVYSLFLDEQVIAASVELKSGHTLHYHQVAMDPDFSDMSPGKLIVYSILRDAFQKGFAEVDLGYGAEGHSRYKDNWATGEYSMRQFLVTHNLAVAGWLKLGPHLKNIANMVGMPRIGNQGLLRRT